MSKYLKFHRILIGIGRFIVWSVALVTDLLTCWLDHRFSYLNERTLIYLPEPGF